MTVLLNRLREWMDSPEDEHLEFKEAKNHFDFEELVKYCAALANEGGGRIIFGVTDSRPRNVTGTQAFDNLERTKSAITERLHLRIDAETIIHPNGPVVIFQVPSRPLGTPIPYKGSYWMRSGESLIPMTPDLIKRIFDEAVPDFSAEICPGAELDDLDPVAIEEFRTRWLRKSGIQGNQWLCTGRTHSSAANTLYPSNKDIIGRITTRRESSLCRSNQSRTLANWDE